MQSPVPICSVTGLSSHEDIDAISSTHLQCYRAEQPWRYWCNPQYPFAVLQGWAAMKILMQSPVPICSATGLSSHKDIDANPSTHLQCYMVEQPWRYWCNPQLPFAVLQGWAATKILMQSPVPICSVTGLSSHKNIEAIPSSSFEVLQGWVAMKILMQSPVPHLQCYRAEQPWRYWWNPQYPFAVLQGWAAMKILMQSPVPICSITVLRSHEDIDAIPSTHLQCYRAEQPWRYWCNPQCPFAVLQCWGAMKILMQSPVPIRRCYRAEQPWRYWCNLQFPFAVWQGWVAIKILMQITVPICSVTWLNSHEDIDALPSSHLQCDRAE